MKTEKYDIKTKTEIYRKVLNLRMVEKNNVWLEAYGFSMHPLIRKGDILEIKPASFQELKVGDIVATKNKYQINTVIMHRLIRKLKNPDLLLTKGDSNSSRNVGPAIEKEFLIGRVVTIKRGRDVIKIDNFLWKILGYIIVALSSSMPRLVVRIFLLTISLFSIPGQIVSEISRYSNALKFRLKCVLNAEAENMIKTKKDLSLENKLLRFCAQIGNSDRIKNGLEEIWRNDLNWPYILQTSKKEGIICLLYQNLLQFKNRVPQDVWNAFKEIYYTNAYQNSRIYGEINIVLSSFNKENLKVIPLKGIFLAEKIYNNIALRTMDDIDLLVKKEELPKIDRVLENLGYKSPIHKELRSHAIEKSYMNSMDYFKTDGKPSTLHIHWHIVNVSLPTYMYIKNIKMDKFWECARSVRIQDVETLQLSPHHLIMHLAEHALKHSFSKLILLSDINEVIKRYKDEINWEELIKEAIELDIDRPLFYGLYFTNYFLDAGISDYTLTRLKPKKLSLLEKRFFSSIVNNNRNTKLCYFVYLNMIKGIINKFRFIFRTLFPPPSVLLLFFNYDKPRVTRKDYLLFLRKRFFNLKKLCNITKT